MTKQLILNSKWSDFLIEAPETGIGYQLVDVKMKDKSVYKDLLVYNSDTINSCPDDLDVDNIANIVVKSAPKASFKI